MGEPIGEIKTGFKILQYLGVARDLWEQIKSAPHQIADLKTRVAELESRLQRCPGEGCPSCGALAFRIQATTRPRSPYAHLGALEYHWLCGECDFKEVKTHYPPNMPKK